MLCLAAGVYLIPSSQIEASQLEYSCNPSTRLALQLVTTEPEQLADLSLRALYDLRSSEKAQLVAQIKLSIPSTSREADTDPAENLIKALREQSSQSGSYDFISSFSWRRDLHEKWTCGGKSRATLRFGRSDNSYHMGSQANVVAWCKGNVAKDVDASIRLEGLLWERSRGSRLAGTLITATHIPGGKRIDMMAGLNYLIPSLVSEKNEFVVEAGLPLYENTKGASLEYDWHLRFGWKSEY